MKYLFDEKIASFKALKAIVEKNAAGTALAADDVKDLYTDATEDKGVYVQAAATKTAADVEVAAKELFGQFGCLIAATVNASLVEVKAGAAYMQDNANVSVESVKAFDADGAAVELTASEAEDDVLYTATGSDIASATIVVKAYGTAYEFDYEADADADADATA